MILAVKMVAVIEGALVSALQHRRLLLVGADAVLPMGLSLREFEHAHAVGAEGSMEESWRRMRLLQLRAR